MPLTVAVQMDHISTISIAGDSTFALLLEAAKRGHDIYHYTPDRLAMINGQVGAVVEPVTVRDVPGNHYTLGEGAKRDLSEFDVVLLRQEPPFDMAYISSTHMLEHIADRALVVNDPREVRNAPEKLFVTRYPDLMPATLITRERDDIRAFRSEFEDIVIKPLYGHGGNAVFRLRPEDENLGALLGVFEEVYPEPWVIQEYRSEIRFGDKRIILVDGEFAGAVNRVPMDDELRSNMAQGGRAEATELTDREREICERIGPDLRERGLLFVGIDVIGGFLTEINVTCPTGIRAIVNVGGPDIAAAIWDRIEDKRAGRVRETAA